MHFLHKNVTRLTRHFDIFKVETVENVECTQRHINKCYKPQISIAVIREVSMALMVSSGACKQVVQGSSPTDGWKVIVFFGYGN